VFAFNAIGEDNEDDDSASLTAVKKVSIHGVGHAVALYPKELFCLSLIGKNSKETGGLNLGPCLYLTQECTSPPSLYKPFVQPNFYDFGGVGDGFFCGCQ